MQAPGSDSEVMLKPCAMYKDPFRPTGNNFIVLCDCYLPDPDSPDGCGAAVVSCAASGCAPPQSGPPMVLIV